MLLLVVLQEALLSQSVSELKGLLAAESEKKQETAARHQYELEHQRQSLIAEKEEALASAAASAAKAAAAERDSMKEQREAEIKAAEKKAERDLMALKAELLANHSAQVIRPDTPSEAQGFGPNVALQIPDFVLSPAQLQAVLCNHRSQLEQREKEHQQERDNLEASLRETAAAAAASAAERLKVAIQKAKELQQQLDTANEVNPESSVRKRPTQRQGQCNAKAALPPFQML